MKNKIAFAVVALMLTTFACALPFGDGALLKDDFSSLIAAGVRSAPRTLRRSMRWRYAIKVFVRRGSRGNAGERNLSNVHIEVTAKNLAKPTT